MAKDPGDRSAIINQLAGLLINILKPGGVSVGGLVGLWYLVIESEAGTAIAATLIGFGCSYLGKLLEPIHQSNQRRLKGMGQAIDGFIDGGIEQLFATATRAEDVYLLCQALDCRDYKPEGMGARDRVFFPMLQEVFVPLELDSSAIRPGFKPRNAQDLENWQEQRIWPILAMAQTEATYRQLAIVAWGGFGKTTLLKHLAYIYGMKQHQKFQVPFFVPILLPLRNYRKQLTAETPPSLPELIMQHHVKRLAELNLRINQLPENWAKKTLTSGKALVMLDGFDEVPEQERRQISRWMMGQAKRFDRSVFILTSRPTAYKDDFVEPLRTKLWVRPFKFEQQKAFVERWYACQERLDRGGRNSPEVQREAKQNAENLLSQIQNRPELTDLAKNPLLLNLLATYHRSNPGLELPRQRAELYQDICTLQLRKRPDARSIELPLSASERQGVLQAIALSMMQRNLRLIPEDELLQKIANILRDQGHSVNAANFLKQISDVSELIVRQGLEGYEFAHLSFQEFLAAAQIKATHNEGLLYPHLQAANDVNSDKAWWRQTILLYAAQTNPARLIKEAMRRGANDLAYACWQETRHTLDNETAKALEVLKPKIQTSRYAELEALLKAGKWVEADSETYRLMITTVGKEKGQWFDKEDLLNFPCEDLKTLDQLWVESSGGKFGFSVQKKIYVDCGVSQTDLEAGNFPGDKIWNEFCDRVGWKKEGDYLNYSDLQKDPRFSPKGELPRTRRSGVVVCIFNSSLASRLVNCSR